MEFDVHLHTIASGHGNACTITDMVKAAKQKNLRMIGISDHGPDTILAPKPAYFQNLRLAPRKRSGLDIIYGAELNILDYTGAVDLPDPILSGLDYAIISMHTANIRPGTSAQNTNAYIKAMEHPAVKIIGHCDDHNYPVDYEQLMKAAITNNVVFEINNQSLSPDSYRGNTQEANRRILELAAKYRQPVLLSSDSHGTDHIGDFQYALELIKAVKFPDELILNHSAWRGHRQ